MSEREHGVEPYGAELSMPQLGDDPVAHRRRRDRSDPRDPVSVETRISRKRNRRCWRITIGTIGGQQPLHQPGGGCGSVCGSRCAALEPSAPPREGIKNTIAPAGNVGKRARCRALRRGRSSRGGFGVDPLPHHAAGQTRRRSDNREIEIRRRRNPSLPSRAREAHQLS